jgi:prepilin-type processing-associated H-X9-DG protein
MRDKLLDYLVGGLDSRESEQVRKALQEDPLLQQQLELLQTSLQPLEACRHYEPPADLKDRTLDFVAQSLEQQAGSGSPAQRRSNWTTGASTPSMQLAGAAQAGSKWTILDVVVAGAILMTASLLFFPLIMNSRYAAQLRGCQQNLQQLGMALHDYSSTHDGLFPQATGDSKLSVAGAYAPVLYNNQFVKRPRLFLCPTVMDEDKWIGWKPPASELVAEAAGRKLRKIQQQMGGTYGYNLGYWSNGRYFPPRNLWRAFYPIMADGPSPTRLGRRSTNHGGNGLNVLFEDGHVQYMTDSQISPRKDSIFYSDRGRVEPGRRRNDAVIGESGQDLSNR